MPNSVAIFKNVSKNGNASLPQGASALAPTDSGTRINEISKFIFLKNLATLATALVPQRFCCCHFLCAMSKYCLKSFDIFGQQRQQNPETVVAQRFNCCHFSAPYQHLEVVAPRKMATGLSRRFCPYPVSHGACDRHSTCDTGADGLLQPVRQVVRGDLRRAVGGGLGVLLVPLRSALRRALIDVLYAVDTAALLAPGLFPPGQLGEHT